jgi:O-antigen ligase
MNSRSGKLSQVGAGPAKMWSSYQKLFVLVGTSIYLAVFIAASLGSGAGGGMMRLLFIAFFLGLSVLNDWSGPCISILASTFPAFLLRDFSVLPTVSFFYIVALTPVYAINRKVDFDKKSIFLFFSIFFLTVIMDLSSGNWAVTADDLSLRKYLLSTICLPLLALLIYQLANRANGYVAILVSTILSCLCISFYALFYMKNILSIQGSNRLELETFDPNYMTAFLGIGILVCFYLINNKTLKLWPKIMLGTFIIPMAIVTLRLGSRTGLIAVAAGASVGIIRNMKRPIYGFAILMLTCLAVFIAHYYGYLDMVLGRFQTDDIYSVNIRTKIWLSGWDNFCNENFSRQLFGGGTWSFKELTLKSLSPHNEYLQRLFDFGFIGMFLFIGLLSRAGVLAWTAPEDGFKDFRLGLLVHLVLFALTLSTFSQGIYPWIGLALVMAQPKQKFIPAFLLRC